MIPVSSAENAERPSVCACMMAVLMFLPLPVHYQLDENEQHKQADRLIDYLQPLIVSLASKDGLCQIKLIQQAPAARKMLLQPVSLYFIMALE